jgi:hypothetical protein
MQGRDKDQISGRTVWFSASKSGKAAMFRYSRYVPKVSRKIAEPRRNGDIRPTVGPTRAEIRRLLQNSSETGIEKKVLQQGLLMNPRFIKHW